MPTRCGARSPPLPPQAARQPARAEELDEASQVAECALKASLSRGGDDRRLRSKALRHNRDALWRLAISEGLANSEHLSIDAAPPSWLQRLSQLHDGPYYLRYSTGVHGLVTPAPEPMCTELERLVAAVEHQVLT
jgi:hypothetical protein